MFHSERPHWSDWIQNMPLFKVGSVIYKDNIRSTKKKNSLMFISAAYSIVGVCLAFIGIYYDTFEYMLKRSPERAILVFSGITIFLVGILAQFFLKYQNRKV